ncbi:hypothetical protein EXIGLDRAFT_715933 [Exidia glandulosa HHB12029]|uniref:Uncharacterized protein n=1 Tax=Exidia glandulosa HHB12029 TaxID=1314781 RepID=A0A165QPM5_EXIGL|nr:hypothetical protein EXIGLDRAFT_715933 [Exidia glandulosa HHB12029]
MNLTYPTTLHAHIMFGHTSRSRSTRFASTRRSRRNPSLRVPAVRRSKPTFGQRIKAALGQRPRTAGRSSRTGNRHVTLVRRGNRTHRTVVPSRSKPSLAARIKRLFNVPLSPNAQRSSTRRRMHA